MEKKAAVDYVYEVMLNSKSRVSTIDGISYDLAIGLGKRYANASIYGALSKLLHEGRIESVGRGEYVIKK